MVVWLYVKTYGSSMNTFENHQIISRKSCLVEINQFYASPVPISGSFKESFPGAKPAG